jgi:hypothetical protein
VSCVVREAGSQTAPHLGHWLEWLTQSIDLPICRTDVPVTHGQPRVLELGAPASAGTAC